MGKGFGVGALVLGAGFVIGVLASRPLIQQQEARADSLNKMLNFVLADMPDEERRKLITKLHFDLITSDLDINI